MQLTNDDVVFAVLMATVLLLVLVVFFVLFVSLYRSRQRDMEQKQQLLKQTFEKELLTSRMEMIEQTLRKVSEEIHDNIGQTLVSALFQVESARTTKEDSHLKGSGDTLRRALSDLRNLSRNLNGSYVMMEGLQSALDREIAILNEGQSLKCSYSGPSLNGLLNANTELVVFRCLQELLSNALRHANASQIEVVCELHKNAIQLAVRDNGRGFSKHWQNKQGVGMLTLQRRAESLGGSFHIDSQPDRGSNLVVNIPLSLDHEYAP